MWRWDQGRLLYFHFDVLKDIAKTLVRFDNKDITQCEDSFRQTLVTETEKPFLPNQYTIKRNYARVFQCSFLANFRGNTLLVTDFCRDLANTNGRIKSTDEYLFNYIKKFRFPFPAFENYNASEQRVYPFCAILKFLIARRELANEAKVSLDDIFNYIVGNACTGSEDIEFYKALTPSVYKYTDTEQRQLREMVIFFSQLSVLKMYDKFLYLDEISDSVRKELLNNILIPEIRCAKEDRTEEFYEMTSLDNGIIIPNYEMFTIEPDDIEFVEGNRKRIEHFRIERSGWLKKFYKQFNPNPICHACGVDMSKRYPWTDYMLDIHHLLPLASSVSISSSGTSLEDIVGLCPSCHRAVHMYYHKWLEDNKQEDFKSKEEAHNVFEKATKEIA